MCEGEVQPDQDREQRVAVKLADDRYDVVVSRLPMSEFAPRQRDLGVVEHRVLPVDREQGEDEQWVISKVLGSRRRDGKIVYRLKWEGSDKIWESTWEDVHILEQAVDKIRAFHLLKRQKGVNTPLDSRFDLPDKN